MSQFQKRELHSTNRKHLFFAKKLAKEIEIVKHLNNQRDKKVDW